MTVQISARAKPIMACSFVTKPQLWWICILLGFSSRLFQLPRTKQLQRSMSVISLCAFRTPQVPAAVERPISSYSILALAKRSALSGFAWVLETACSLGDDPQSLAAFNKLCKSQERRTSWPFRDGGLDTIRIWPRPWPILLIQEHWYIQRISRSYLDTSSYSNQRISGMIS